jgi:hypothetical protein
MFGDINTSCLEKENWHASASRKTGKMVNYPEMISTDIL